MGDDSIPTDGEHRGVGLHSGQSEARLVAVRRDIDHVHGLSDLDALVHLARDTSRAPEARLFARAKAIAVIDDAVERRAPRSRTTGWTREDIKASAAGCASLHWRSPWHYGSLLDPRPKPGEDRRVRREHPLPEKY